MAGWNDSGELVVGSYGQVYFAPIGTTLPAKNSDPTTALAAAFVGAGYLTEDGFSPSIGSEVTDFMAWQEIDPVRRERTGQQKQVSMSLQQWNETNLVFAFGGGVVTSSGANYTYTFPEGDDALDERSLVIDANDGDKDYRFVFGRGNVTDSVDTQFQRGATALLPITFKVLKPADDTSSAYIITNDPAFATGS